MTFKVFLSSIFSISVLLCTAQKVRIEGEANQLIGFTVELAKQKAPFSSDWITLDSDTIDENGNFLLESRLDEITLVSIRVNRFKTPIYLEPGGNYTIAIPNNDEYNLIPFWRPGNLDYYFIDIDTNDVNRIIRDFDSEYLNLYLNNEGRNILSIRHEVKKFEETYAPYSQGFEGQYKRYSVALLKLTSGSSKLKLYEEYLKNDPIILDHPAYSDFFNNFYPNFFESKEFSEAAQDSLFKTGMSLAVLDSLMSRNEFFALEEIRQWVMVKSIREEALKNDKPSNLLNKILDELELVAINQEIVNSVRGVQIDIEKRFTPLPVQKITDGNMNIEKGKPGILVVAFPRGNERTKEANTLENLLVKYGDYFQVIEYQMSSSLDNANTWMRVQGNNRVLVEDLSIFRFPWYGWFDENGMLVERDLFKPSDGLEERLYGIKAKADEQNRIKIGQ